MWACDYEYVIAQGGQKHQIPWSWTYKPIVGSRNQTQDLCKSNKCS